jgi:hypothetical protein
VIARALRVLALLGVCVVLAFYAEVLAHAPVAGQDFRTFYVAATMLHHSGNPYDIRQSLRQKVRLHHPATLAQRALASRGRPL